MERSCESAQALTCRAVGPLATHLGAFVASLIDEQYVIACAYVKALHAVAFDRWLDKQGVALCDLGEKHISQYQRSDSHRRRSRRPDTVCRELCNLTQLLAFLRQHGACAPAPAAEIIPAKDVATDFERHLRHDRGLATVTVSHFSTIAQQFLIGCFGSGPVKLGAVHAADVIAFVRCQSKRMRPCSLKRVTTGLRSFLRYAQYRGEIGAELVASVPSVAAWSTTPQLPRAIAFEHAQSAIDSCDRATVVGRRDRAVLLILARLGLRAAEIIKLELDDIDWDSGHLRVRGKGRHEALLPLPADVGEAVAAYLEHGRPVNEDRHLFLRSSAPIRGLKERGDGIGSIVCRALRRAKVDAPHRGSHQFRHALAVRMLQSGASLPEIGEVLRHRSPQSTSIYAKVDIESLRDLAAAWPGGAR